MSLIEAIEVHALVRRFGSRYALRGVTARFAAGQVTLVEGENGAGKSTLLKILATLLSAHGGHIYYPPLSDLRRVRAALGWVGHESLCYPALSGRENIELMARLYGCEPKSAAEVALSRVGAREFSERPLRVLSRGQKQRIALARALVHRPGMLLLDEPATGLDRESRGILMSVLREERERGVVVVVASHSPELADQIGDARITLVAGQYSGEKS